MVEAWDYPISGTMYHPETQTMVLWGKDTAAKKGKINNDDTDEINYYFSKHINKEARRSLNDGKHRFANTEELFDLLYTNHPAGLSYIYTSLTLTYGVK
jgi:hypothetical protein